MIQKLRHECGTVVYDFAALGGWRVVAAASGEADKLGWRLPGDLTAFIFSADAERT